MQDRVTICNDADKKKNNKKNPLEWLYFFIIIPDDAMSISLTLTNIIIIVKNNYIF